MSKPLCAAILTLSFSLPALAAEPGNLDTLALRSEVLAATPTQRSGPDPQLAANLSLWVPLVGLLTGPGAFVASPALSSAGHFYAGDPWRGTMITLGGFVVPTAGLLAGFFAGDFMDRTTTSHGPYYYATMLGISAGVLSSLGYVLFASKDAYGTAERQQPAPQGR